MSDYHSPLNKYAGQTPANEEEIRLMRRRAWREQGVLSVILSDSRLDLSEKEFLKQIAERLGCVAAGRSYSNLHRQGACGGAGCRCG